MGRRRSSPGGIVERQTARGKSYALRFRAFGERQFVHLGYEQDGWTRKRAADELAFVVAEVARGKWEPPAEVEPPPTMPDFHSFSSEWFARREQDGLRDRTLEHLRWALTDHLLPAFRTLSLDRITVQEIDRFKARKHRAGQGLSASSCNRLLRVLAAVLDDAVEYRLIDRNPARGKKRRLKADAPRRTYLDRADHIDALIEAGGELDRERSTLPYRRALLATLALAGLRIGEVLALRWRDVELAVGRIRVPGTKTDAAVDRTVYLLPLLRDELAELAAVRRGSDPDALVFATATGKGYSRSNIRQRVLAPAVERANANLARRGIEPLPEGLTHHALRRTFASVLYALGRDPGTVMDEMGHADEGLALRIYRQAMRRGEDEKERLRALVNGSYRAPTGTDDDATAPEPVEELAA